MQFALPPQGGLEGWQPPRPARGGAAAGGAERGAASLPPSLVPDCGNGTPQRLALVPSVGEMAAELSAAKAMVTAMWCASPAGWRGVAHECGMQGAAPNRCRHCEPCRRFRRLGHFRRIKGALADESALQRAAFLTLTSTPGTTVADMMAAVKRFIAWLRRTQGQDFEYAAIKERGKRSGMLHLHIVVLNWGFVPQAVLSREWERLSGAFRVDIRRLYGSPASAAGYVAGYVAKAMGEGEAWGKAVTYSRGFPKPPDDERLSGWRATGETWAEGTPSGRPLLVLPSGFVVTRLGRAGCDCVTRARVPDLAAMLALRRYERGST